MRYKVGDKVRVRGDLEAGKRYGNVAFIPSMEKNKTFEILFVRESENYDLNDEYNLCYSPEMLRPAEFKIWCETEKEKQAVIEELEKEGYVWRGSGEKPTKHITCNPKCGLYVRDRDSGLTISYDKDYFNEDDRAELTPSEFTGIDFSHKSKKIIIEQTKTGAKATYKDKWSYVEGDFEDASRQALAEVLCPFKIGDRVKVTRNNFTGVVKKVDIYNQVTIKRGNCETTEFIGELEPYTEPSYNAKLFCIEGHGVFKQGVVYTVENGMFVGVHGSHFRDLEDINTNLASQFMEVKGGLDD